MFLADVVRMFAAVFSFIVGSAYEAVKGMAGGVKKITEGDCDLGSSIMV